MLTLLALALAQSPCQPSEVTPAAPSSTNRFWEVMAADEDRLMVGQETGSGNLRRLLVFERAPGTGDWVEVQELALGAAQGSSLLDLALDGDRAVASAEGSGGPRSWTLVRDRGTGLWSWDSLLWQGSAAGSTMSVSIHADDVAIGHGDSVRCFRRGASGWQLFEDLFVPDVVEVELSLRFLVTFRAPNSVVRLLESRTRVPGPGFLDESLVVSSFAGRVWALDDDRLLVSSEQDARVFSWVPSTDEWVPVQVLTPPPPPPGGVYHSFDPVVLDPRAADAGSGVFVVNGRLQTGPGTYDHVPAVFTYRLTPFGIYEFDSVLLAGLGEPPPFDRWSLGRSIAVGRNHVFLGARDYAQDVGRVIARVLTEVDCDQNGVGDSCDLILGGAFDLNRNSILDRCEEVGVRYCGPAAVNSTGEPARMGVFGRPATGLLSVDFRAEGLPEGGLGTFMASQGNQVLSSPLYNGDLCLGGGSIYRNLGGRQLITGEGTARVLLNRPLIPDGTGGLVPILPGDTWYFQYWFYDPAATPSTGFSDAVGVTFTQF